MDLHENYVSNVLAQFPLLKKNPKNLFSLFPEIEINSYYVMKHTAQQSIPNFSVCKYTGVVSKEKEIRHIKYNYYNLHFYINVYPLQH